MRLTLAGKTPSDEDFLFSVYASTRREEMALVGAMWSEAQKYLFLRGQFKAQQEHYQSRYPNAFFGVVELENQRVGRLYTAESADEIRIVDIAVLPEFRGRGVGGKLVADILQAGAEKRKAVQIYIENFNPSANFFSQLGFRSISAQGIHVLWRWANF